MFSLNFYYQEIWQGIVSGVKTIETRALNLEEPERYFGDVKVGDELLFVNKSKESVSLRVKVTKCYYWKNFHELWAEERNILQKIYADPVAFAQVRTYEEFIKGWDFTPGYIEKVQKNGMV